MKIYLLKYWKTIILFLIIYSITAHVIYLFRSFHSKNSKGIDNFDNVASKSSHVKIFLRKYKTLFESDNDNSRQTVDQVTALNSRPISRQPEYVNEQTTNDKVLFKSDIVNSRQISTAVTNFDIVSRQPDSVEKQPIKELFSEKSNNDNSRQISNPLTVLDIVSRQPDDVEKQPTKETTLFESKKSNSRQLANPVTVVESVSRQQDDIEKQTITIIQLTKSDSDNLRETAAAVVSNFDSVTRRSNEMQPTKHKTFSRNKVDISQSMVSTLGKLQLSRVFSNLLPWNLRDVEFDLNVQLENNLYGPTGDVAASSVYNSSSEMVIAIGGGITSRKIAGVTELSDFVAKFQFFNTFLPTFCATASSSFVYRFYLAYDHNDPVFANPKTVQKFQNIFTSEMLKQCLSSRGIRTSLHLVTCDHTGRPTWAQNDAMLEAYLDHVDYFYRINDDTRMKTNNWTQSFIRVLNGYNPPKIGVVGPNHSGGNTDILTYDFVHRTHVDVFGFYYPRLFTDWWGDDWVTKIYRPKRSTKLQEIHLDHTKGLGKRYGIHKEVRAKLAGQLRLDRVTLERYIKAVRARNVSGYLSTASDGRRVIAMSLFGRDSRHTWGVIRNAQLVPVHFPGWRLRVYVPKFSPEMPELSVPLRVINKLKRLGVDIARVSGKSAGLSPCDWRLLVADDHNIDYFLIRNADSRLSDRESSAVNEWIAEVERSVKSGYQDALPFHCIKDHPKHAEHAIVDGLWGGRPQPLYHLLGTKIITAVHHRKFLFAGENNSNAAVDETTSAMQLTRKSETTLEKRLWSLISGSGADVMFHDVVSPCENIMASSKIIRRPFPVPRIGGEYVGQSYDEHQELVADKSFGPSIPDVVCTGGVSSRKSATDMSVTPVSTTKL